MFAETVNLPQGLCATPPRKRGVSYRPCGPIEEKMMKSLIVVLILFVAGVVGLGFYLGWFHFGSDRADGKDNLTLTVDEGKFKEDKKTAMEKMHNLGHAVKDKAVAPTDKSKE
jgi:hypothetical protein